MNLSDYWSLNGVNLISSDIEIVPTRAPVRRTVRQSMVAVHGGTESRENVGLDLPRLTFEIVFLGSGIEKFDEANFITQIMDTDDVWTLESPALAPMYLFKTATRIACSTVSWALDPADAHGRIVLTIEAVINGIWIADDGEYEECTGGHFTRNAGPTYTRQDDTNTGSTPLVRLPVQSSGYPLAVRASDFARVSPTASGSLVGVLNEDGVTIYYQDYDMTGFLIPAPTATGDVGVYEICSSPSRIVLGGGIDLTTVNSGIASGMVGGGMVGS